MEAITLIKAPDDYISHLTISTSCETRSMSQVIFSSDLQNHIFLTCEPKLHVKAKNK